MGSSIFTSFNSSVEVNEVNLSLSYGGVGLEDKILSISD